MSGGEFAHDAVNRFLNREQFGPQDLFEEAHALMALEGGTLSVDDRVLEKPYSQEGKADGAVKGLCLVTLLYTDVRGSSCPVNFRLVDKSESKTKNEHFRDRVEEILSRVWVRR